ncbi:hypothetical protein HPB51_010741 [Rhipicephalus microplus]|uniref:Uncharacterized protein n=1 Tax=Rhipicephalus microplus TaxID=6941 RepID=A0A9J6DUK0_RHIMP|nr:hypothetical protein HPB51_010741 [Rhipicephalus microplus]
MYVREKNGKRLRLHTRAELEAATRISRELRHHPQPTENFQPVSELLLQYYLGKKEKSGWARPSFERREGRSLLDAGDDNEGFSRGGSAPPGSGTPGRYRRSARVYTRRRPAGRCAERCDGGDYLVLRAFPRRGRRSLFFAFKAGRSPTGNAATACNREGPARRSEIRLKLRPLRRHALSA